MHQGIGQVSMVEIHKWCVWEERNQSLFLLLVQSVVANEVCIIHWLSGEDKSCVTCVGVLNIQLRLRFKSSAYTLNNEMLCCFVDHHGN